jgi:hypothetical protein
MSDEQAQHDYRARFDAILSGTPSAVFRVKQQRTATLDDATIERIAERVITLLDERDKRRRQGTGFSGLSRNVRF